MDGWEQQVLDVSQPCGHSSAAPEGDGGSVLLLVLVLCCPRVTRMGLQSQSDFGLYQPGGDPVASVPRTAAHPSLMLANAQG